MRKATFRLAWVLIAVALGFGSFASGDIGIVCGWLYLVWTLPFGVIWWFWLYDYFHPLGQSETVQIVREVVTVQVTGVVIAIAVAYLFWFVAVPAILRRFRPKSAQA